MALLQGPGMVDVAALARQAVADGADLLGVAGGDGTQALVAGIAAEHGLPFLVISAGTCNHFALDLGLDREDPAACLDALTDGQELRVDLGVIADRTFVNNASFGAYAEVVRSPAYRDDKRGTTLQTLPDLLSGHRGARLSARAGGITIEAPQALLVSNGPYEMSDIAGLGRRARLDAGTLGVVAVRVDSARQAIGLLRRGHGTGLTTLTADEVTVDADAPQIPVGIDGETVSPHPSAASSSRGHFAWSCPGNGLAFPPPSRPWNGGGCGSSRPSAPRQRPCRSPPSQPGSQARKNSRRWQAVPASGPVAGSPCWRWPGRSSAKPSHRSRGAWSWNSQPASTPARPQDPCRSPAGSSDTPGGDDAGGRTAARRSRHDGVAPCAVASTGSTFPAPWSSW